MRSMTRARQPGLGWPGAAAGGWLTLVRAGRTRAACRRQLTLNAAG